MAINYTSTASFTYDLHVTTPTRSYSNLILNDAHLYVWLGNWVKSLNSEDAEANVHL